MVKGLTTALTALRFPRMFIYIPCSTTSTETSNSWFGQNSKKAKFQRQLNDVQTRMRLRASGDKADIRMAYIPGLHLPLVESLVDNGAVSIATRPMLKKRKVYYFLVGY